MKRFLRRAKENGYPNDEKTAFFQGDAAEEFINNNVPERHRSSIREGWDVTWLADPWEVGHWYGFDAHTVCEK